MIQEAVRAHEADSPDPQVANRQAILQLLASQARDQGGPIAILEAIQGRYGYLPETALRIVSEETGRSLVDIYGIATFYRAFSLVPRGRHLVCACLGTACHVRGAPRVVEELERQLGIQAGETTPDGEFTLETVNCLGACALGPVVVIDGRYFSKVGKSKIRRLLDDAAVGLERGNAGESTFPMDMACPECNHSLMDDGNPVDGLPSARMVLAANGTVDSCHLSSLYGGSGLVYGLDIAQETVCRFYCPHCQGELIGDGICIHCGAPTTRLAVSGGGMLCICRRHSCHRQRLDLECVNG